jgi:UDP-3-O-[3-hydroxymyristoyl] glucosamine N-acyltransferase
MGANCCVDRAAVGDTQIGVGSKLSDGVVIGHGAKVGRHNLLVGQVGIAGSTVTGDHVSIGGQAGIAGHLNIGAGARIAAGSKVMHDIPEGEAWGGIPAGPLTRAKRTLLQQQRLPQLVRQVADLEQRLRQLEAATTPTGSST